MASNLLDPLYAFLSSQERFQLFVAAILRSDFEGARELKNASPRIVRNTSDFYPQQDALTQVAGLHVIGLLTVATFFLQETLMAVYQGQPKNIPTQHLHLYSVLQKAWNQFCNKQRLDPRIAFALHPGAGEALEQTQGFVERYLFLERAAASPNGESAHAECNIPTPDEFARAYEKNFDQLARPGQSSGKSGPQRRSRSPRRR